MVLGNYITLTPGVPKRLHFIGHAFSDAPRMDPQLGIPVAKRALVLIVDREDGQTVTRTFSTLASKLADKLAPDLVGQQYTRYEYVITQFGSGYTTNWTVEKQPYAQPSA